MMVAGLTRMQRDCLGAIQRLTVDGVPPSFDEIGAALGLASRSSVHRLINGLQERGCIEYLPRQARSIRVVLEDHTPPALERMSSDELRLLIARAAGVLAHREGGEAAFQQLDRIGRRLSGRPRNGEHS